MRRLQPKNDTPAWLQRPVLFAPVIAIAVSLATALVYLTSTVSAAENIGFVRENIFISIHCPDTMWVRGEYFFASKDGEPVESTVLYPFPIDSNMAVPESIRITVLGSRVSCDTLPGRSSVLFKVVIAKHDTTKVTVTYCQCMKRKAGRYILTTTHAWRKPLVNSTYFLSVPRSVRVLFLSFMSDTVYAKQDSLVYFFAKKYFMPDRDLTFSYELVEPRKSR